MPVYTSQLSYDARWLRDNASMAPTGGTAVAVLNDSSDSTYDKATSPTKPHDFRVNWPAVVGDVRIVSACPWVRSKQPGTKAVRAVVGCVALDTYAFHEGIALTLPTVVSSATDYAVAAQNGQQLMPGTLAEWQYIYGPPQWEPTLSIYDSHTASVNLATWYKAGLTFYAVTMATIANPTAPTGTVTTTSRPTCTATVSSIVESWQVPSGLPTFMCGLTVLYMVYAGTHAAPPTGANPVAFWTVDDTVDTYIDGTTPTTKAISSACPVDLPNGAMTLFAYVSREHPSGTRFWSSAGVKTWTQNVALPTAASVTCVAGDTEQRMVLGIGAVATTGYDSSTCQLQVERLVDAEYREVRGLTDLAIAVGSTVSVYDYECDRVVENTYRVRTSMWHTVDAVRRYSAWVTISADGPAYNLTGWNLKTVDDPASNFVNAPVLTAPAVESQTPSGVLEPMDRDRPVVLLGAIGGFSGSLEVSCLTAAQITALEALAAYRGIVYLEDAFGGAKWVAVTKVAWTYRGTLAAPARRAAIEYTEVGSGLAAIES